MEAVHALVPAIIVLLIGVLAILLMRPLRLSPIVGYLLAGALIGPHGFSLIQENMTTHLLAELGVVFLLFDIGLHFSLGHLWDVRRDILGLGPLQVGLCTAALGTVALAGGFSGHAALVIGATLALSSTAVAVQTLSERGQQRCPIGTTATAVLIFQDICAIFLLILTVSMAQADTLPGMAIGMAAVKAALAFAVTILIGRYLIGPLLRRLASIHSEEIFTALALLIVLVAAAATGALGLSLTLGAFLGGMMLSETLYRHVIQTEVKPFRGLLLGFFFITVGMTLDAAVIADNALQILGIVLLLVSIKAALTCGAALVLGAPLKIAIQLGFLLSQASEFAFVILAMPALRDALGPRGSAVLMAAVAASLALTPTLSGLGNRVAKAIASRQMAAQRTVPASAGPAIEPVLIFGMNEAGRQVADGLEAHAILYAALELDHDRFIKANSDGYPVAFGDAADLRLMETFELAQRSTLVITIVRYEVSQGLTPILRARYPNLTRFIAVDSEDDRRKFEALGMRAVVDRSIPKGLDLAATVLRHHGVAEKAIHAWMRRQQDQMLETLGPAAGLAGEAA